MPARTTQVQQLMQQALVQRNERSLNVQWPEVKVTLRLSATDAFWLSRLAKLMDSSRTRAAGQLLSAAIQDAVNLAEIWCDNTDFRAALQEFLEKEFPPESP